MKRRLRVTLTTRCRLTKCAEWAGKGTFHGHSENTYPTATSGGSNPDLRGTSGASAYAPEPLPLVTPAGGRQDRSEHEGGGRLMGFSCPFTWLGRMIRHLPPHYVVRPTPSAFHPLLRSYADTFGLILVRLLRVEFGRCARLVCPSRRAAL